MAFTETTTEKLLQPDKQIDYRLELCTNYPESSEWAEYAFEDFKLVRDAFAPAVLDVTLVNTDLEFSNEQSPDNRVQLLSQVKLTVSIDGESSTVFQGRIQRIRPADQSFAITCFDWLALINECDCEISLVPDETVEITTPRSLALVAGGGFGNVFGFTYQGVDDPAFNADVNPGTRRRAWAPGDIRLFYDAAGTEEVPPLHYRINLTGGSVTILEDVTGRNYYLAGVRCYIEGTLDWAQVFREALLWPKEAGGIGAAAEELDMPDTGLDLAGPLNFRGRVVDLIKKIQQEQQANLRLWYDPDPVKYKLRVVVQAQRGEEDWALHSPVSISQPRSVQDLFSRVVVHGKCERPRNALTESTTTITDITSTGDWFAWDGLNVGEDAPSTSLLPLLFDGDGNLGAGVHNLASSAGGGTNKYDSWYGFIKIDLGEEVSLDRIRVTMPGSRNVNALAGHQGLFWPGIRITGALADEQWRLLTPALCGRYEPGKLVEAAGDDLIMQRARYLLVELGAYKHGFENHDDPSIGLAELEIYVAERYEVIKAIQNTDEYGAYEYTDNSTWSSYHPGLLTRLAGRHRTRHFDLGGVLNEYMANDFALDQLAESTRLFKQFSYHAVADPRVGLYETVAGGDEMNGDIGVFLVERVAMTRSGTRITGTDYRSPVLGETGAVNG